MVLVGVVRWRVAATAHRGRGLVATEKRDSHRSPPMVHRFACGCAWVPAESGCGWGTACPMMECCWSLGGEAPAAAFVAAAGESRHSPSSLLWSRTPTVCSRQRTKKAKETSIPHRCARGFSEQRMSYHTCRLRHTPFASQRCYARCTRSNSPTMLSTVVDVLPCMGAHQ